MPNISFQKTEEPKIALAAGVPFAVFARSFNWFVGIVCLLVLAAGYWFLIRPKYEVVVGNEAVMAEEQQYEAKISYLKELNETKNLYRSISETDKEKIDLVLSARQDSDALTIALLREIGYVARLNGAVAENMKPKVLDDSTGKFIAVAGPEKSVSPDKVEIINVSFTLNKVDYPALKRILARLEQSLRLLDVTKVDYNPAEKQAQIELYAYHLAN